MKNILSQCMVLSLVFALCLACCPITLASTTNHSTTITQPQTSVSPNFKTPNTKIEMAFPIPACFPTPCPIPPQPGEPCGPFVSCQHSVRTNSMAFVDFRKLNF